MKFLFDEREYRSPLSTRVYVRCVGDAALLLSCESLGRRRSFLSLPLLLLLQHSDHHFLLTSWTIPCLHSLSYSSLRDLPLLHLALSSWFTCALSQPTQQPERSIFFSLFTKRTQLLLAASQVTGTVMKFYVCITQMVYTLTSSQAFTPDGPLHS